VTGATGSLGAHVVAQLSARTDIARVYCLVRARSSEDAYNRVQRSLLQRKIYHTLPLTARSKIIALPSTLADARLGLAADLYSNITQSLRSVIHCAWSVNFNMGLSSFEKDCILGVRHLLDLCHAATGPTPATFDFCSSVSTVARCPFAEAPESLPELSWAQNMGYAQSKLVAENLCMKAAKATGIQARVLRVGQIVADTVHGVWNATEGVPLIMQTALTVGALPRLTEMPSWTPVDVVAKAVTEIALSDAGAVVANVTNNKTFSWTEDLLPALRGAGLTFDEVEPKEWIRRLRASNPDPVQNPPMKLVEFFASKYDRDSFPTNTRTYETRAARAFSPSLEKAPVLDQDFVTKFVKQFITSAWRISDLTPIHEIRKRKQVIIIAGPCGSGKTTIAQSLARKLNAAFVEADELHTSDAVSRMTTGSALSDSDRIPWLERIKRRTVESLEELGYDVVVIACSALRKSYRDQLREMRGDGLEVTFVDLQCEEEKLKRRMGKRVGHYMAPGLLESQMDIYEGLGVEETDCLPVDAGKKVECVVSDIEVMLSMHHEIIM
jgi:carbohydrate kinase (thermoresistant glucokinase family)